MKNILFASITCFLLTLATFGQSPDQWRGLVLDLSTPEDAVKTLGTPKKEMDKVPLTVPNEIKEWVTKRCKEKIFRLQQFDLGKEGVQKVYAVYLDNKLVEIMLDVKSGEVSTNAVGGIYGVDMYPAIGAADLAFFSKDYERNQGRIYPKSYPAVYYLVGVADKSFVAAMVANVPSFLGALGKSAGVPDKPGTYPGKVEFIQLISRTLENKDGSSILK